MLSGNWRERRDSERDSERQREIESGVPHNLDLANELLVLRLGEEVLLGHLASDVRGTNLSGVHDTECSLAELGAEDDLLGLDDELIHEGIGAAVDLSHGRLVDWMLLLRLLLLLDVVVKKTTTRSAREMIRLAAQTQ